MKITDKQIRQIIKEEIEAVLDEGMFDTVKQFGKDVYDKVTGAVSAEVEPVASGIKGAFEQDFRAELDKPGNEKYKKALDRAQVYVDAEFPDKKTAKARLRAVVRKIKKELDYD